MNKVDQWIKPGAIVPITHESVAILIDHINPRLSLLDLTLTNIPDSVTGTYQIV
jgi:hypothetical protein